LTKSSDTAQAFNAESKLASTTPNAAPVAAAPEAQSFYLNDFKSGYSDGYNSGLTGQGAALATTRAGYNEGFKTGFADGYQSRADVPATTAGIAPQRVVYRSSGRGRATFSERKRNSTLKTVLTIAAPAALGAGVGGAFGGKKGAGVGALLGGGGGALYHLIKNR
jgi:hypothetical protein